MFNNKTIQLLFSVLAAALLWLLLIFIGNITTQGSGFHRLIEILGGSGNGYIQAATYGVFIYSLFELLEKRRHLLNEFRGFDLQLLPTKDQLVLTPDEVARIKLNVIQHETAGAKFLVSDFIKKACTQFRNEESVGETLQVFNAQVDNSKSELESNLEPVRYLQGAIMTLGFIGTLIGLSTSIGKAHLARTVEGMPEITRQLNLAFDTTLVALLVGLILNFFYHRYLQDLDTFYSRSKTYVIDNLISRIYKG